WEEVDRNKQICKGDLVFLDIGTWKEIRRHRGLACSGLSGDGKQIIGWSDSETLRFWDIKKGTVIRSVTVDPGLDPEAKKGLKYTIMRFSVTPDAKWALGAMERNQEVQRDLVGPIIVKVWNLETGELKY